MKAYYLTFFLTIQYYRWKKLLKNNNQGTFVLTHILVISMCKQRQDECTEEDSCNARMRKKSQYQIKCITKLIKSLHVFSGDQQTTFPILL